LTKRPKLKRKLKVVVACGNGTAGAFAPQVMEAIGCEVVPLDTELDYTFPKYNPNPEDMEMLHAIRDVVLAHKADVGLGFDGDGDRCGVVDNTGEEIFADKVGVMLARDMSAIHKNAQFVVDVKSTGLFVTDPVLQKQGAKATYWKTGHSYMKRRTNELGALAGFEKSGHFFFNAPFGRGYDDGLISAIAVCEMLDRAPGKSMADLKNALPKTWSSPTMSPHCSDEAKYGIVDSVVKHFEAIQNKGGKVAGLPIRDLVTVNGVRVTAEDGSWGLVRASSNKPELVVVVESPVSEQRMRDMFEAIRCCAPIPKSASIIRRSELSPRPFRGRRRSWLHRRHPPSGGRPVRVTPPAANLESSRLRSSAVRIATTGRSPPRAAARSLCRPHLKPG
jgi:phosphomannomutase/phosphoglucomutase